MKFIITYLDLEIDIGNVEIFIEVLHFIILFYFSKTWNHKLLISY